MTRSSLKIKPNKNGEKKMSKHIRITFKTKQVKLWPNMLQ